MKLAIIDQTSGTLIIDEVDDSIIDQSHGRSLPEYVKDTYGHLEKYVCAVFTSMKKHRNGKPGRGTFEVRCNGEAYLFPESRRQDQIDYYTSLLGNASGKEAEQYSGILESLVAGRKLCSTDQD